MKRLFVIAIAMALFLTISAPGVFAQTSHLNVIQRAQTVTFGETGGATSLEYESAMINSNGQTGSGSVVHIELGSQTIVPGKTGTNDFTKTTETMVNGEDKQLHTIVHTNPRA